MPLVFIFIGLSFSASLLCLLFRPVIPGIVSMTASVAAILAFALLRRREREPVSNVVRVDGVTLETRGDVTSKVEPAAAFELEDKKKRIADLEAELDTASRRVGNLESSGAGLKELIRALVSSEKDSNPAPALRAALVRLEMAMRNAAGFRESLAGQSEKLSEIFDKLKKRRSGESFIETSGGTRDEKALLVMASTLEELCEQSNVIAVNAAIEAARIGKEGKGFSVIAGEMQKSAGQAKNLADEFRVFRVSQTERRNSDDDREKREQTLNQAVAKASAISVNLTEDANRLIAAAASGGINELAKLVQTEIESRERVLDQLHRLLKSSE